MTASTTAGITAVRRFPRTGVLGKLVKDLQLACQFNDVGRMRELLTGLRARIEPPNSHATPIENWNSLPCFDPSSVKTTRWLIDSFLAEGSIQLVVGERGSFKSTLLMLAVGAVASGMPFLGMKTRQRRVLYLDYENPASVIKKWSIDLKLDLLHNDNLKVWNRFGAGDPPRPDELRLEDIVQDCLRETMHGPWIIFDSWASLLKPGEGGELTGQIAPIFVHFRKLVDLGATVTVLDHTKKYEKNIIYGGQDKEAKADSILTLIVYEKAAEFPNVVVRVESWHKRFMPKGEGSFAFKVLSERNDKGNWHITEIAPTADPEVEERNRKVEILRQLIQTHPSASQSELATAAGNHNLARDEAIKLLQEEVGKKWRVQRGSKNSLRYSLI